MRVLRVARIVQLKDAQNGYFSMNHCRVAGMPPIQAIDS
jgi:hypothetical protein